MSFFSLPINPINVRVIVTNYFCCYQTATTEERALYETLTFISHQDVHNITQIFNEKVALLNTPGRLEEFFPACSTHLESMAKRRATPLFIGPHFRLYTLDVFTPSYPELVCHIQAAFPQAKEMKAFENVTKILKLAKGFAKGNGSVDLQRVQASIERIFDFGNPMVRYENATEAKKHAVDNISLLTMGCSHYFQIKKFIEHGLQFVTATKRFQRFTEKSQGVADPDRQRFTFLFKETPDFFEKILKTTDLEERTFYYRWIKIENEETLVDGKKAIKSILQTKLMPDCLVAFRKKYLSHKSPLIRSMAATCIETCNSQKLVNDYKTSLYNLIESFILIYYYQPTFIQFTDDISLNFPEFMQSFKALEKRFSFFNLPNPDLNRTQLPISHYCHLFLKNPPMTPIELANLESMFLNLKKFEATLHFIYRLEYTALSQYAAIAGNGKKAREAYFKEFFGDINDPFSITLPMPNDFPSFFNVKEEMQFELDEAPRVTQVKESKRDYDVKGYEPPEPDLIAAPSKTISLQDILNIRDFPLHDFKYDKRVYRWFLELEGDWAKANWDIQSHAFDPFIDRFVGTVYSQRCEEGWINTKTKHKDLRYLLFADIIIAKNSFSVTIEYTKGKDIWYHRCMNRHQNAKWDEVRSAELQKSADARKKGGEKTLPAKKVGIMDFDPLSETVLIDFKTYQVRLHRLR